MDYQVIANVRQVLGTSPQEAASRLVAGREGQYDVVALASALTRQLDGLLPGYVEVHGGDLVVALDRRGDPLGPVPADLTSLRARWLALDPIDAERYAYTVSVDTELVVGPDHPVPLWNPEYGTWVEVTAAGDQIDRVLLPTCPNPDGWAELADQALAGAGWTLVAFDDGDYWRPDGSGHRYTGRVCGTAEDPYDH